MEQWNTVVIGACMLSIAIAIFHMIRPDQTFTRQIRFLVSLLFITSLAAPVLHLTTEAAGWNAHAEITENPHANDLSKEMERQILTQTEDYAAQALTALLEDAGISCTEMDVTVHIDDMDSIYISEVSTVCGDYQNACRILQEQLGEDVTLSVTEILA